MPNLTIYLVRTLSQYDAEYTVMLPLIVVAIVGPPSLVLCYITTHTGTIAGGVIVGTLMLIIVPMIALVRFLVYRRKVVPGMNFCLLKACCKYGS